MLLVGDSRAALVADALDIAFLDVASLTGATVPGGTVRRRRGAARGDNTNDFALIVYTSGHRSAKGVSSHTRTSTS